MLSKGVWCRETGQSCYEGPITQEAFWLLRSLFSINHLEWPVKHTSWLMSFHCSKKIDLGGKKGHRLVRRLSQWPGWESIWLGQSGNNTGGKAKIKLELGLIYKIELIWPYLGSEKKKGIKHNSEILGLSNCMNGDWIYEIRKAEKSIYKNTWLTFMYLFTIIQATHLPVSGVLQ